MATLGTWVKVALAAGGPSTGVHNYTNSMVYDASQDLCLYYDGGTFTTWSWDGVTWTLLNTVSTHFPIDWTDGPQVINACVVYDDANQQVMLFGGFNGTVRDHQYTWDWGTAVWTEIFPSPQPTARSEEAMVFDGNVGKVIMFGGLVTPGSGTYSSETWTWDGTTWVQLTPATTPQARGRMQIVWDRVRQNVVMFGGRTTTGSVPVILNTTFVWDGTDWTELFPATPPDNREGAGMCFDTCAKVTILFAGVVSTGTVFLADDTWSFDGAEWTDITASVTGSPVIPEDQAPAMAYYETRREATVKKGVKNSSVIDGDTWVLPCTGNLVQVMRWH